MAIFPTFFLGNIGQKTIFYDILAPKKTMGLVEKWPFFQLFFLGNIGPSNVFHDILEQKNAFLTYKNKKLKK